MASLEELWGNVLREPDNPESHKKFINFAVLSQQHLEAVERYGELEDQEIADKYKKKIALQVAAMRMVPTAIDQRDVRRARLGWLLVGTGIGFCLMFLVTRSLVGLIGPVCILIGALEIKQSKM